MKGTRGIHQPILTAMIILIVFCIWGHSDSWGAVYFSDDMENASNWVADSPWATTTAVSHSGTTAWTDSPGTYYANNLLDGVSLTLNGAVDLSSASSPQLVFWHKYQLETDFDFGYVEISSDGGITWNPVPLAGYSGISDWKREQISLSAFAGFADVRIRFRMTTDKTIAWDGWTIDDVAIGEPPHPVAGLTVSNPTATSLDLSWEQNLDSGFASYRIYRSTTADVTTASTLVATLSEQGSISYTDSTLSPETTYYYKVFVFDSSDLSAGSTVQSGTTTVAEFHYPVTDDMEGAVGGWTAQAPWGLTTESAYSGTHAWTDSPGGSYAPSADASLQMTVDLGLAVMPVLSFWHRYSFDTNSDYGYIEVREEGTTVWNRLYFATGSQASWVEERMDLSGFAGKQVDIRFRVISDANGIQSDGWYIDDVRVGETLTSGLAHPFLDDMEGGAVTTANWHSSSWALVTDPHSGNFSFTDSPAGDYGSLTSSELIMANSIDLTGSTHPQLTFWHKYETRSCEDYSNTGGCDYYQWDHDYIRVYLSTFNGQAGTWTQLAVWKGSQPAWTRQIIDLSPWAGLPNVRIKFVMEDTLNDTVNYRMPGWWIDDVAIEEAPVDVTLSIDSSSMNSVVLSWTANADTDFQRYELFRSTSPNVSRSSTLVATINTQGQLIYTDAVAMVQPITYYYRMWVVDQLGNISMGSNEVHATYTVPDNLFPFADNGESGTGQWSYGSPWGLTAVNPRGGAGFSWTDTPGANYAANTDTSLTMFLDLSSATTPVLSFWHHYALEQGIDFLKLEISTDDGNTWSVLRTFTGTETSWNQERVNLTPFAGNSHLGLRFRLVSDGANQQDGWYMDDLSIAEEAVQALYPFIDAMESGVIPWFYTSPWGHKVLSAAESRNGESSTVWTDSPEGAYAPGADTELQLTVDLGAADMPVLTFWQKYALDANSDYGYVETREEGTTTWSRLYFTTGTQAIWAQERVDLSGYAGKKIDIRFRLVADDNGIQSDGWYIDDVTIDETPAAVLAYPFFDDMEGGAVTAANWHSSSWSLGADAHSGNYSFTDSPVGDYGPLTTSELILSNSIDLTGAVHPQLTFWNKYETRSCEDYSNTGGCDYYQWDHDYVRVLLSTYNGQAGTWTELFSRKGSQPAWTYVQLDLSPWAGLPNVRIKFVMEDTLDDTVNYRMPGWTIDDVAMEEAPVDVTLGIDASSMNSVSLSWTPNADADFGRYEIYRSSSPGVTRAGAPIASISAQAQTSHTDPVSIVQPGTYYYRIWVFDEDGNVSLGSNEVQATYTIPQNTYPFLEDGESGTGKWSWGAPWGLTDVNPFGGAGFSWTDSPGANYGANADTSLTTFLDLSGSSTPVLTFWHKYSLESGVDFLNIEVSTDNGQTWATIRSITGVETYWNQERINLTSYAGNARLGLRFRLNSDGANQQDGWYMDGLTISEEAVSAVYPFYDDMENGIIPWFYGSSWGLKTLTEAESHTGAASTVWTDSPGGSYRAGEDTSLYLTIDLGSANMPVLTFWHRHALETNSDHGYIEVREVGSDSWDRLYFVTATSSSWLQERMDLSGYAGKQVDIRFRLASDTNGTQSDGWYIDDISIDETLAGILPYPFFDDMEGGAATAANWHSSSWELGTDANSGNFAYTDSPAGDYGSLTSSALALSGTVSLRGAVHPQLSFWHKYETRSCEDYSNTGGCDYYQWDHDYLRVYLSTYNGQPGTWTQLMALKGSQPDWIQKVIDLSTWAGLPNVRIKFVMEDTLNDTVNYRMPGWTLDDVRIGEDPTIASYIQKISGDGQTGQAGMSLPSPFRAKVFDPDSRPKPGILVDFAVTGGDGSLSVASATSDAEGLVQTMLTLGATVGANTVTASIDGTSESVTFTATGYAPDQAMAMGGYSGDNQVNAVDLALPNPLVVKVTDILGAPVSGVNVSFSIVSGGGTLGTTDPVATDGNGLAGNTLTLGATPGMTVVSAASSGLIGSPVSFTAHAVLAGGVLGDTDGDGIPDSWESANGLDPLSAADAALDGDEDTLSNLVEYTRGTNPNDADTDHDGMPDDWEIRYGLNPLNPGDAVQDADGDGISNLQEYVDGTVPVLVRHFGIAGATSESMDFYGAVMIDNAPAQAGDEVAVLDPDGVICGQFTVSTPGQYGFMHVYKDDPATVEDEGAEPGDELFFRLWDAGAGVEMDAAADVVTGSMPPTWTADRDVSQVNLSGASVQSIPLHAGWNLVSFSVKACWYTGSAPDAPMLPGTVFQVVADIGEVFSSIDGLYEVVRSFDGQGAHTYDPMLPEYSDLTYVAGGYGYWIKMSAAGNLELKGIRAQAADGLALRPGWNLVGYWHPSVKYVGNMPLVAFPPDTAGYIPVADVSEIVNAIAGNYFVIRSHDIDGAHTYDPLLGAFNDLRYLGPGYGIWIKMKTAGVLSY